MDARTMIQDGRSFWVGMRVQTPLGPGVIVALLPGYDIPIAVHLDADDRTYWFALEEIR